MPSMLFRSRKDRGKPPGPRLPVKLLFCVTRHMEKRDAPSLATVCKSWQDPAESIIWETVSLALGASWDERCLGGVDSRAELNLGPTRMTATRRDETLEDTPVDAALTWPAHGAEMERRVKEIEGAFSSRPQRAKHVRRLILEPTSRVWDRIVDQMWPSIEHLELDLFGITGGGQQEAAKLVEQLCDNLRRMGPSGRLRVIELKLSGDRSEDVITTLLRLAPNLTGLYLRQTPDDLQQMDKIDHDKWSGITVHSLKRMDWTLQCDQLAPIVDHLIKQAPRLEDFRFKDDTWDEDEHTTIVFKSLAKAQTLRRMTWDAAVLKDLCPGTPLRAIRWFGPRATRTRRDDLLVHLRRFVIDSVDPQHFGAAEQETQESNAAPNPSHHHCPGILQDCPHHWWEDSTDYQRRPVPSNVLCDSYNSLGETPDWFQPSRLPMPQEGLRILQDWRSVQKQPRHGGDTSDESDYEGNWEMDDGQDDAIHDIDF